jgi:hypothetical protein
MKYSVHVPLAREEIQFPNRCPFSNQASPRWTVRLKRCSTSIVIPLPGGFLNSYSTMSLRVPAGGMTALLAVSFEAMIWLSILGGMAVAGLLTNAGGQGERYAVLFLPGGLVAALGFRVARWFVLRRVRIRKPWNGFMEVRFASESYAREFSELNRLSVVPG